MGILQSLFGPSSKDIQEAAEKKDINKLLSYTNLSDGDKRSLAYMGLALTGKPSVLKHLLQALKKETGIVQGNVEQDLKLLVMTYEKLPPSEKESFSVEPIIETLNDQNNLFLRAIGAGLLETFWSTEAESHLINALNDRASMVRERAAIALGKNAGFRAVPYLIHALQREDNSDVKVSIMFVLEKIGDLRCVDGLIQALEYNDRGVRGIAAFVLGNLQANNAIEALVRALGDWDDEVRSHVSEALQKLDSDNVIEELLSVLNDDYDEDDYDSECLRINILEAIGALGNESATECLTEYLDADSEEIREAASKALLLIKKRLKDSD